MADTTEPAHGGALIPSVSIEALLQRRAALEERLRAGHALLVEAAQLAGTIGAALGTFSQLYATRGDMVERGVVDVFRKLSWDYKTNEPVKFGKRVILERCLDRYGAKDPFEWMRLHYSTAERLDDLLRMMHILDGKPEPDHRDGAARTLNDAGWPASGPRELTGGYLSIKGFRKGTAHVTFMRLDLVDRMNAILAKHHPNALPASQD